MLVDRVAIAQTQVILNSVKVNVIAGLVTAFVALLIVRDQISFHFLILWFVAFVLVTIARVYYAHSIEKVVLNENNYKGVVVNLTILATVGGSLWGLLGFMCINSDDLLTSTVLLMIFTGLVANAAATLSSILPIFIGFSFAVMLPAAYKFYSFGEFEFYWITALIFLYLSVTLINIRGVRSSLKQSVQLRYENIDLIEGLKIENAKTQAALEKAEQANLAKSRFLAASSHDLRQPLQSLSMFTATLSEKIQDAGEKKIVTQIEKSVKSLEGLFNALLDISSLDAGTLKVNKQHFRLKPFVHQVADEFAQQAQANNLWFDAAVEDVVVYTDPVLLGRILRNLIENAIRYTPSGGIRISGTAINVHVTLCVVDTGLGISEDKHAYIFGEFVQLNNPERDRNKGLGLGLSIVRRLSTMLDLELTLESTIGEGASFTVRVDRGDANLVTQYKSTDVITTGMQDLFILVIDDEEDVRLSLEGLLQTWGCVVMVSSSGEEAVTQIKEYGSTPDVIISDYRLRNNANGGDAIRSVRKHCGVDLPAIIVTGDIAPERLIEIDKLKLPVLHKPCNPDLLRSILLDSV